MPLHWQCHWPLQSCCSTFHFDTHPGIICGQLCLLLWGPWGQMQLQTPPILTCCHSWVLEHHGMVPWNSLIMAMYRQRHFRPYEPNQLCSTSWWGQQCPFLGMLHLMPCCTAGLPINAISKFDKDDNCPALIKQKRKYQSMVRSFGWLAQSTHPDLSLTHSFLSMNCNNPSKSHWNAAHCALHYIYSMINYGLRLTFTAP